MTGSDVDGRSTWQLVLEAARTLDAQGSPPFRLADLVAEVQRIDPARQRSSIQPVVQGMTVNAGKGPSQPCGKPLVRVDHGRYQLRDSSDAHPITERREATTHTAQRRDKRDVPQRVEALIETFDDCAAHYDASFPFRRSGQYELHRRAIDLRMELGSVQAAVEQERFVALVHETLQAWGIGRRGSKLVPLEELQPRLVNHLDALHALEQLQLEASPLPSDAVDAIWALVDGIGVVANNARIVAGTKTLHHLLPSLVPPMDRAWTGRFFNWTTGDAQYDQERIFRTALSSFNEVAVAVQPSRLVGDGWRTSPTKLLDNALIGFTIMNDLP